MYITAIEDRKYKNSKINWWDNVYGFDMSCMKKVAVSEPLVDCCENHQVCCRSQKFIEFDLYKVKVEDLSFSAKTEIVATRNEYIHGLLVYFQCEFSKTKGPVRFSTGPFDEYTHWKQTIFYLHDYITVTRGEKIQIEFSMKPNGKNKRDLDMNLKVDHDGAVASLHENNEYKMR